MNPVLTRGDAQATSPRAPGDGPLLSLPGPVAPVPRLLHRVSLLVIAAALVMGVLGALRTGISWDEPYHVMRLRNFLDHGWFALDWSLEGTGPGSGPTGEDSNTLVYGPVTMLLLHALGVLTGVESWGSVSTTPEAYDVRHLGVLLIGLAGTAAAAGITRVLTGSWRWATVTAAVLLALPMWTGHLMFNIKDVPVASGYTITTLALVMMVAPVRSRRPVRIALLVVGVLLMVGTRPAMATALAAALGVFVAGLLASGRFGNGRTAIAEAVAGVAVAGGLLLAVYPDLFGDPGNLVHAAEQSSSFRDGREAVRGYIPFFVAVQTPLLLLGAFLVGLTAAVVFGRRRWRSDTAQATRLALVGAQLLVLPLVAVARNSDLYNGLRQLLFAAPVWAVLTTLGLIRIVQWSRQHRRTRIVGGVAAVALLAPLADQVTLFPYQYTYYNVAMDATGRYVPSDYWRTSAPELLPEIPTDGQIVCGPTRTGPEEDPARMTAGRFSSDSSVDCRTDPIGPLSSRWSADGLPLGSSLPHDRFYALIDRGHPTPANCARVASVERTRHGREVTMTYLARCTLAPAPLGAAPVEFRRAPDESTMTPARWAYAVEGWTMRGLVGIDATGRTATFSFAVPAACAAGGCALEVGGSAPGDLEVRLDDGPGEVRSRAGGFVAPLPAADPTPWITFSRASGAALDLHVRTARVVPLTPAPMNEE